MARPWQRRRLWYLSTRRTHLHRVYTGGVRSRSRLLPSAVVGSVLEHIGALPGSAALPQQRRVPRQALRGKTVPDSRRDGSGG